MTSFSCALRSIAYNYTSLIGPQLDFSSDTINFCPPFLFGGAWNEISYLTSETKGIIWREKKCKNMQIVWEEMITMINRPVENPFLPTHGIRNAGRSHRFQSPKFVGWPLHFCFHKLFTFSRIRGTVDHLLSYPSYSN